MSQIPYTSIDRIFNKLERDFGSEFNEGDVIEWTGEALEAIGAVKQYEEAVAYIKVVNHQISLPTGFHAIIQIARNACYADSNDKGICAADVVVEAAPEPLTISNTCPNNPVVLDCNGQPLQEYELAYYRPYFDLQWEYGSWATSKVNQSCFKPVYLADNVFFNSLVCSLPENQIAYQTTRDEYTIIAGNTVRFSFESGQIALAYLRQVVDPVTGWPMIPDHYSYVSAIVQYITYKLMSRNFYNNRQGSESRLQKSESDWHWYCKQAGNYSLMIKGVDEHENQMRQRSYMIPQTNRYHGFFGKLAHPESRRFNNPDGRKGFSYFRGQ